LAQIKTKELSSMRRKSLASSPLLPADNRIALNPNNLNVTGTSGNDLFVANRGDYSIEGGGAKDTIDYSAIGTAVTIGARGVISKGAAGTDTIRNVQHIIGAIGQANTIDATGANGTNARISMDLSQNTMMIANLPGGGSQTFIVDNFTNAIGTSSNDTIVGNSDRNQIDGNDGNDSMTGGSGDDLMHGGNGNDIINGTDRMARGVGEVDSLTGGGGANTFILGDKQGAFYLGNGRNDYAVINGYDLTKDRIQLSSVKGKIRYRLESNGTIDLFVKQQGQGDDLIAKIVLAKTFSQIVNPSSKGASKNKFAISSMSGLGSDLSIGSTANGDLLSSQMAAFEATLQ
jgi:Ca2+-binding RTX toxin-like protein